MDDLTRERYPFSLREVEREKRARPTPIDRAATEERRKLVDRVVAALYWAARRA